MHRTAYNMRTFCSGIFRVKPIAYSCILNIYYIGSKLELYLSNPFKFNVNYEDSYNYRDKNVNHKVFIMIRKTYDF